MAQRRFASLPNNPVRIEKRVGTDLPVIAGVAAPFYKPGDPGTEYQLYEDLTERIMPGCFDRALKEDDCRGLFNHNVDFILGRCSAGTMKLSVDKVGLRYEIQVPDTQAGRDVLTSIRRGDVTGSSFSFLPHEEKGMVHFKEGDRYVRELHSVKLFDCGPVSYPAYSGSTTGVRALDGLAECRQELEAWRRTRPDTTDLDWLARNFAQMNADLFGGRLTLPRFEVVKTSGESGDLLGSYRRGSHTITIDPDLLSGRHPCFGRREFTRQGQGRYALDILLHEMVHAATPAASDEHGPAFIAECERVGGLLGGMRSVPVTADNARIWPEAQRKKSYYRERAITYQMAMARACEVELMILTG
jgi:HK97 family phage prohead protease